MTDRCNFITVALSGDLPEDDVKPLVDAILMIRGVIGAEANVADSGSWTARMQARQLLIDQLWTVLRVVPLILTLLFAAGFVATARADDDAMRDVKITLGQVRELQVALAAIEMHDGKPVATCLGDIRPPCIPVDQSSAVADDIVALSSHWNFYQSQAHKLIAEASGGSGYLAPGSKDETIANFRLFDLSGQSVTVRMRSIDINRLQSSGVQIAPTIKAILMPISK
jgi:hypothetical protein